MLFEQQGKKDEAQQALAHMVMVEQIKSMKASGVTDEMILMLYHQQGKKDEAQMALTDLKDNLAMPVSVAQPTLPPPAPAGMPVGASGDSEQPVPGAGTPEMFEHVPPAPAAAADIFADDDDDERQEVMDYCRAGWKLPKILKRMRADGGSDRALAITNWYNECMASGASELEQEEPQNPTAVQRAVSQMFDPPARGRPAARGQPATPPLPRVTSFDLQDLCPRGDFRGRTVVMLGSVGQGKSTIVEKITGQSGLSSDQSVSFTRAAIAIKTKCQKLQIIDTPGNNAIEDKLEHNLQIAYAMSHDPVTLILLTVKADTRIDQTVDLVRAHAERFLDFADLLCVCVTHMDTVSWDTAECMRYMQGELGITSSIFIGKDTTGQQILRDVLASCQNKRPKDIRITSDNFLKYFKINDSNMKIMKTVNDEVNRFEMALRAFENYIKQNSNQSEKMDCAFEFQAYMNEEIIKAQQRVAEANQFQIIPTPNEIGHLANLTNKLKSILLRVRTLTLGLQEKSGAHRDLRKCPHCGLIWAKIVGCTGMTTCGNRLNSLDGQASVTTFEFSFLRNTFNISKRGNRQVQAAASRAGINSQGCGKPITWSEMAPVEVPQEWKVLVTATVDDVEVVNQGAKESLSSIIASKIQDFGKMTILQA